MDKIISFVVHKRVWNVFKVSNSCLTGLGCPLLRGLSDRRLRRRAATLPVLLKRTFPGSISFSAFAEVTAAMKDLVEEYRFSWVRHLNETCRRQSLCKTSPSCRRRLRSLEASILGMFLTAPMTAGYNRCYYLPVYELPRPVLPRC